MSSNLTALTNYSITCSASKFENSGRFQTSLKIPFAGGAHAFFFLLTAGSGVTLAGFLR